MKRHDELHPLAAIGVLLIVLGIVVLGEAACLYAKALIVKEAVLP